MYLHKNTKATIAIFSIAIVLVFSTFGVYASTGGLQTISTNINMTIRNAKYTSYVLNVYTSGTPSSGNSVTAYTYSGSSSQQWTNTSVSSSAYALRPTSANALSLNYNQATGLATVYAVASNVADDYYLKYIESAFTDSNSNAINSNERTTIVRLANRQLYMYISSVSNGTQLQWESLPTNGAYDIAFADTWSFRPYGY